MITDSLTVEHVLLDDGIAYPYKWNGDIVLIRNDARTVIDVIDLFRDEEYSPKQKQQRFFQLFFVDAMKAFLICDYDQSDFEKLITESVWDICGLDLNGKHSYEEPLWDLEEDAAIIRISFRQDYGLNWDSERSTIPFSEFISMVGRIGHKTPLGQALYYRNPKTKPKLTKYNQEQVDEWTRLHRAYALKQKKSSRNSMEAQNAAMNDDFAALKKAAR